MEDRDRRKIKLLALSGSLRERSYNSAALRALAALAPAHVDIDQGRIDDLPLFNPDLEPALPETVMRLKAAVADAQGLLIASPEYAHGISGPMKNALDWLVSGAEFPYKSVMLINTSPRATVAAGHLREVLRTMSAEIVDDACIELPLLGSELDTDGILATPHLRADLCTALATFCDSLSVERTMAQP